MLKRWWAPMGAGLGFLVISLGMASLHAAMRADFLNNTLAKSFSNPAVKNFAIMTILREVLPLFLMMSLLLWVLALAWSILPFTLGWDWRNRWTWTDGLLITGGLLGCLHLALWWKVPSTLWLFPGLDRLPFWLDFGFLLALCLTPLLCASRRTGLPAARQAVTLIGWLFISWGAAMLPLAIGQRVPVNPSPTMRKPKVLLIGLDGLRADTLPLNSLDGTRFENAYTAIPATRLLFSILWGGDPSHYSVGHVFPDLEELRGLHPFTLLDAAAKKGLKTRFYIDDGGTVGLAGRTTAFDEVLMPARGWENFVNSNFSGYLPLYASWMDMLRVFPGTHPWASMDAGLRQALESGRGADLVMFHSCLAHLPSFLTRKELAQIPRWWTLRPRDLLPLLSRGELGPNTTSTWDVRRDPFLFYQIRMRSILEAWTPIWKALELDPDYKGAVRVLFSDHGERFYHATETIRLAGVHGFDIDPWQVRVPLVVAGPGFKNELRKEGTTSLLNVRNVLGQVLLHDQAPTPESFQAGPFAPIRYHTLDTSPLRETDKQYHELSVEKILTRLLIQPEGLWYMTYDRPAAERAMQVTLAQAFGDRLIVFKPLLKGGAHQLDYKGYKLEHEQEISQEAFDTKKVEIEAEYFKFWDPQQQIRQLPTAQPSALPSQ